MGIDGLLKLLDPIVIKEHISTFRGQTAAIDIMSWLYKGCYRCAYEHNQNIQTNAFLYYVLEMLDILAYYKIKPIAVFDGRYVGKKDQTIQKRKKMKEQNKQKGLQFLQKGNQEEARKYLSRCIIIDDKIITLAMRAFFTKGIEYIVAPYESDSQIAKLIHLGIADFAITQDSDLLMYNVKAVLKLTQDGECDFIDLDKWKAQDVDTAYLKVYLNMNPYQRIQIGVLAGSDYNSSIKGIGIKRAIKNLSQRGTINGVIQHLRKKKNYSQVIPQNYESIVLDSKLIFNFATVYNPLENRLQYFNPDLALIQELKPQDMDEEELRKIVDIKLGKVNARNMEKRQIIKIDIKEVLAANVIYNLNTREIANLKRREHVAQIRKKRMEERANMPENSQTDIWKRSSKPKKQKVAPPPSNLTEEERRKLAEQRKVEKAQRFSEFKNILNSFVLSSSSQSQSNSSEDERQIKKASQKKTETSIKKNQAANTSNNTPQDDSDNSESCSQSFNDHLQALNPMINPWAKH